MKYSGMVGVTSRSFSKNLLLRRKLQEYFSEVKFNEDGHKLTGNDLVNFLTGCKQAIIGLEIIDEDLLCKLPNLKVICKMGSGVDNIAFKALKPRNIAFAHTPSVNKRSVSELVLGLIFILLRRLAMSHKTLAQGEIGRASCRERV